MTIRNESELERELMRVVKIAVKDVTKEMADELSKTIWSEFYVQYTPSDYVRTYQLLNSAMSATIKETRGSITVQVFIDFSKMNYHHRSGARWEEGSRKVPQWASQGYHGNPRLNIHTDGRFWNTFVRKFPQAKVESMIESRLVTLGY